ncbi:unnamed protein product [Blepharisma stoltei]|uniref:Elongation factor G, mitochondrial n=1 Tax=Blepharisma stoltei TaxID=1481888 RepID=A0AAU9J671_9CILI|nr:unnamed protein product [Blepharisma stoltei]
MQVWLRRFPLLRRSFSDMTRTRNIGISAHIDSGKTTFTERVLFYTGKIKEIHEVKGNDKVGAKMDSMELERERGITIQSAATYCKWKDININLIDTPGHVDFTIEVERALRVLDGAVLLVCGASGVQSQTMTVDRQMRRYNVPRLTFINKLDRAGSNYLTTYNSIKQKIPVRSALIQLPIGQEDTFSGIIDVIERKAYNFQGRYGEIPTEIAIPENMLEKTQQTRQELIENLADVDDFIGDKFLNGETLTNQEIKDAVRRSTIALKFSPILMGSAYKNKGAQLVLDAVGDYLPSPYEVKNVGLDLDKEEAKVELKIDPKLPLVCLAFKLEENRFGQLTYIRIYQGRLKKGDYIINTSTKKRTKISRMVRMHSNEMAEINESEAGDICALFGIECNSGDTFTDGTVNYAMSSMYVPEPVISLSIRPIEKNAGIKFNKALAKFQREDPTFRVKIDEESNETIISGMGELHLQIYAERIRREFELPVELGAPAVNYRETIHGRADFNYLHKKQTGGNGQYAGVQGYIEPIPDLKPGELVPSRFVDKTIGNNIGGEFKAAIQKAFLECCKKGPQVGYPVLNLQYVLIDGQTHVVDSNSNAFMTATKQSFRHAFPNAKPTVLEPVMTVEITAPHDCQATVINGLVKRRALVKDTFTRADGTAGIIAEAPLAQMFGYASEIRGNTQGQGEFSMEFSRLEPVDPGALEELKMHYQEKVRREGNDDD